jgi:hypothetical protein
MWNQKVLLSSQMHRKTATRGSLAECLRSLRHPIFWPALPCREAELTAIHSFIREAFDSAIPRALVVCGGSLTGKTSCLRLAAAMSPFASRIHFADGAISDPTFLGERQLIVFDPFGPADALPTVVCAFSEANYSMIFAPSEPLDICAIPMDFCPEVVSFGQYSLGDIVEILREKAAGFAGIPDEWFARFADVAVRQRGGVPRAVALFEAALRDALGAE